MYISARFGRKYDGEFKDGKRHGHGVYTGANGDKYDGEWKDGKWHGHGIKIYKDEATKVIYSKGTAKRTDNRIREDTPAAAA